MITYRPKRNICRSPRLPALLGLAAILLSGCGKEGQSKRHLESAERHFAAADYASAEIEYRNVLQDDPQHAVAIARLGAICLDRGAMVSAAQLLKRASELEPEDVGVRTRFAQALLALGFVKDAREQVFAALELAPADGEALILLAETAVTPETMGETAQRLEQTADPDRAPVQLAAALLALRQGDQEAGEKALRRALELDPESARTHALKAKLADGLKDPVAAEESYKRAVELASARSPEVLAYAGFLLKSDRREEAVGLLEERLVAVPDYLPGWRMLARIAFEDKDYELAGQRLDKVLQTSPIDLDAGLLQAQIWLLGREADKAVKLLGEIQQAYPPHPDIEFHLALARLAGGELPLAEQALDKAITLNPNHARAVILQARLKLSQGNPDETIRAMEAFLKTHPANVAAQLLLVDGYRAAGRLDDAVAILRARAAEWEGDYRPHFFLGTTLRMQGKPSEARQAFEKALELAPDNLVVTSQLVALDLAGQDYPAARRRVDEQLAKQPEAAEAHFLSAEVFARQSMAAGAEQALRRAIELKPDFLQAYDRLIQLQLSGGRSDEAIGELQRLLEQQPDSIPARMQLATLQQGLGRDDEARQNYQRIIELNPEFVPALNNLAVILSGPAGQPDEALKMALRARALMPEDGSVADTLGWIHYQTGDYPAALSLLQDAAGRMPDHPVVQTHLGMAAYMMGEVGQARSAFEKALAVKEDFDGKTEAATKLALLDAGTGSEPAGAAPIARLEELLRDQPDDVIVRLSLARALKGEGRFKEAAATFEHAIKVNPDLLAAHLGLATLYAGPLADPAKALESATKARQLAPGDPQAAAVMGRAAFRSGNHESAHSLLQEALGKLDSDGQVQLDFAWAAYSLGRIDQARSTMQRVVEIAADSKLVAEAKSFLELTDPAFPESGPAGGMIAAVLASQPDHVPALMARGRSEEARSEVQPAVEAYQRSLELYPRFTPARVALARVYLADPGKLAEAEKLAVEARRDLPDDLELSSILARINFRKGEFDYAAQILQEVARQRKLNADELHALGISLAETDQGAKAQPVLQQALDAGLGEADAAAARAILDKLRED